ncbi:Glandular kallikrein [Lamellibrachia satsuma]|nr:Glandular kallikrein [Lamellibrachia satsuma]
MRPDTAQIFTIEAVECGADSMRNTKTGGFSVKNHTYRYIAQSEVSRKERKMRALVLLAVAALIGVCACAYLREDEDFDDEVIDERDRRDALNIPDAEDEDIDERQKRRVLTKRKNRRRKPKARPFIAGGAEVTPNAYPMMVSIQAWGSNICGGVLIHPRWVLTAAHCLGDPWEAYDLEVAAGVHDITNGGSTQQTIGVNQMILHKGYNSHTEEHDIGLLKLSTAAQINSAVKIVKLPTSDVADGTMCEALGWGHTGGRTGWNYNTFPDKLQGVALPVVNQATCGASDWHGSKLTSNMLCAGYAAGVKDTCNGDSGGPLLCTMNNILRVSGIISWGDGCGKAKKPGVYTRVTKYLAWIKKKTGGAV